MKVSDNMLYAIIDVKTGWSLKLNNRGMSFMPHGFPILYPKQVAQSILSEQFKNQPCYLRLEVS